MRALAVTRAGQLASWAEWGCDALFYSLFGNQVCEGPGTMQRLSGLPVTSRTLIQGGRRQRAGAGQGESPGPAQASPRSHASLLTPGISGTRGGSRLLRSSGGKSSYQIPRRLSNWNESCDSYLCENATLKIKIKARKAIYPLS